MVTLTLYIIILIFGLGCSRVRGLASVLQPASSLFLTGVRSACMRLKVASLQEIAAFHDPSSRLHEPCELYGATKPRSLSESLLSQKCK